METMRQLIALARQPQPPRPLQPQQRQRQLPRQRPQAQPRKQRNPSRRRPKGSAAVFLNPGAPGTAAGAAAPTFGIALLGKPSVAGGALDTFAYVDRAAAETYTAGHLGFTLFDDKVLLDSLQQIGTTSPAGLAATIALEAYLAATAKASWSTDTVRSLSVEFLTAFGVEMTPRLDVNHRVRATKLSPDDVRTLSTPPFNAFVDQSTLRTFQAMP